MAMFGGVLLGVVRYCLVRFGVDFEVWNKIERRGTHDKEGSD